MKGQFESIVIDKNYSYVCNAYKESFLSGKSYYVNSLSITNIIYNASEKLLYSSYENEDGEITQNTDVVFKEENKWSENIKADFNFRSGSKESCTEKGIIK